MFALLELFTEKCQNRKVFLTPADLLILFGNFFNFDKAKVTLGHNFVNHIKIVSLGEFLQ